MKKKVVFDKMTLLMIPLGVAINFVAANVIQPVLQVVFGDSIGTILIGAMCGPLAGVIVGFITNIVNIVRMPILIFYAALNMAFGVIAGFLSKRYWFRSFPKTLVSGLFYALIGGGIGTFITWNLFGGEFLGSVGNTFISIPLWNSGVPKFLAMEIGSTTFDIIDKIFCVIVVFFIIKALPDRFLIKLRNGSFLTKKTVAAVDSAEENADAEE
jgi:energy-coupling factor transport system substrate-specific component